MVGRAPPFSDNLDEIADYIEEHDPGYNDMIPLFGNSGDDEDDDLDDSDDSDDGEQEQVAAGNQRCLSSTYPFDNKLQGLLEFSFNARPSTSRRKRQLFLWSIDLGH